MGETNSATAECRKALEQIGARVEEIGQRLADIAHEVAHLEEAGMYDALPSESWESRGGEKKYLRLVFPTQGGQRRKVYIGCDPAKVAEARAKIERRRRWEQLQQERQRLERRLRQAQMSLDRALRDLGTEVFQEDPGPVTNAWGHRS